MLSSHSLLTGTGSKRQHKQPLKMFGRGADTIKTFGLTANTRHFLLGPVRERQLSALGVITVEPDSVISPGPRTTTNRCHLHGKLQGNRTDHMSAHVSNMRRWSDTVLPASGQVSGEEPHKHNNSSQVVSSTNHSGLCSPLHVCSSSRKVGSGHAAAQTPWS